ncbi:hypothetical protein AERO8C_130020 [Aeromonas veronii]|uniref:Uncharacterized protein n=1 Tax=Aeromonas veronii TaxID=654 RepID=A0A653KTM5_AERVE|nr:hypothetical protein AERO8C_130020 [Aeromonas veronii]
MSFERCDICISLLLIFMLLIKFQVVLSPIS